MRETGCGQVSKNETSVKNGLSLDPKSNEMAENSQNLLSLESVFDIDALFICGSKVYGLCLRGF